MSQWQAVGSPHGEGQLLLQLLINLQKPNAGMTMVYSTIVLCADIFTSFRKSILNVSNFLKSKPRILFFKKAFDIKFFKNMFDVINIDYRNNNA